MLYNYGSINIDHVYRVSHLVRPGETLSSRSYRQVLGGKGANQSLAIARAGGHVMHWGLLGQGDHWVLETLSSAGVDISRIEVTLEASGHALIQVDDQAKMPSLFTLAPITPLPMRNRTGCWRFLPQVIGYFCKTNATHSIDSLPWRRNAACW